MEYPDERTVTWIDDETGQEVGRQDYVRKDLVQAAVAAALGEAALIPMDRQAAGRSVAPADVSKSIKRLITTFERVALYRVKAETRREDIARLEVLAREHIAESMAHPDSGPIARRCEHIAQGIELAIAAIRTEAEKQ